MIKERNLVKIAVESGAYRAICTASVEEREHELNKYAALLTESYCIDEMWARKALMWCVDALNIEFDSEIGNLREKANQTEEINKGILEVYLPSTPDDAFEFYVENNECSVKSLRDKKYTEIIIPKKYQGKPVTTIGDDAFNGCKSLTRVMIPPGVTTIGDGAFMKCESLTSITIPDSVTTIGASAFNGCESLTSVTMPSSVKNIGALMFSGCESLMSVTIPPSVEIIGSFAFDGCKSLTSVTIPSSVKNIGAFAFERCESLTSATIPSNVKTIEGWAFYQCKSLTSVILLAGVITIGEGAFRDCESLKGVRIPPSVITIENYAFYECKNLTSVTISEGVITIGDSAFRGCEGLISVTIPSSVRTIGDEAFFGCKSLRSVTIPSSVTTIGEAVFGGCPKLISISGGTVAENGETTTGAGSTATGIDTTKSTVIYSPMNGRAVKLEDVPDEAFASGLLGSGVAIDPSEGKLYAPFDGTVAGVFDTKHAYSLINDAGAEMLIHIGLDTVKLNGKYFTSNVSGGQKVRKGDLLAEFDLNSIRKEYRMFTPILLTNAEEYSSVEIVKDSGPVKVGDVLYTASIKQEEKRNLLEYRRKQGLCSYCGGAFKKGLFSTKCRNCGRKKDY